MKINNPAHLWQAVYANYFYEQYDRFGSALHLYYRGYGIDSPLGLAYRYTYWQA